MNPLQHRLASLRHRLVLVNLWRGVCSLFAVVVSAVLIEGLADYWLHLPSILRALCLVGAIGATLAVAMLFLIVPLARRYDDLTLALKVEEVYPELNDVLGSAVQFLDEPEENLPGSKVLRHKAVELAENRSAYCDFNIILDRRGVFLLALAAVVLALTAGHLAYHHATSSWTAVCRLGVPFGGYTWTTLEVPEPPLHRVGQGWPFAIHGTLSGIPVSEARIDIDGIIQSKDMKVDVTWPAGAEIATFDIPLNMSQKDIGKFWFRIFAGDATFPAYGSFEVDIMSPPRLAKLNGQLSPQIELTYPTYTGLKSPDALPFGQSYVDAVVGTRVTWRAAIDRKVTEAWFKLDLAKAETSGARSPSAVPRAPAGSIPCRIDKSGTVLSVEFTPPQAGTYEVHFKDADGLENESGGELRMFIDPPPSVKLRRPASKQMLLPEAEVTFQTLVEDEIFAIRSVWLEYRRKNANGVWLDNEPQREIWFEPTADRPKSLEQPRLPGVWPLAKRFKEGETVVLCVCADDFNDLVTPKLVGRSDVLELHIVGKEKLDELVNEAFQKIQQDIVRLSIEQDQALKLVRDTLTEKNLPMPSKDKKLVVAETNQGQIQKAVGTNDEEGLRQELADLKRWMEDNKMPPSELKYLAATVASKLEGVARTDLQQIESALAEARWQMNPEARPDPKKPDAQKNDPLQEAKAHQEEAKKIFDELVQLLGPWASVQHVKYATRAMLHEQKEVKIDTDGLKNKVGGKSQAEVSRDEALTAEMKNTAERQQGLFQKAEGLVKIMSDVMQKQKDTEAFQRLAAASKLAKDAGLTKKMSDIRDMLNQANKVNEASQEQQEVVNNLQNILSALEEQPREKEVERLRKKIKTADQRLDDLNRDLKQLQNKMKMARNMANPEKRAAEMKRLAQEEKELKEKFQEESRELSRLRADRASRDLAQAARDLDQAGKKMDSGEDPAQDIREAEKRLAKARENLQQADQELAREQQAQVAERIKGLKDRQDAAVKESERIHNELKSKNSWSTDRLTSLKNSAGVQKGLAQEAENLKKKLEESPVFAHILDKTKRSMTQAAEAIQERQESSAQRGTGKPLEKEDLAEENKAQDQIVKLQEEAGRRLQRLLDALQPEQPQAQKPMDPPPGGEPKPNGEKKPQKTRQLPPTAEIKALISEQDEIKLHKMEFDERCPDPGNRTPDQQEELRELKADQERIQTFFQILMKRTNEKGGDQ